MLIHLANIYQASVQSRHRKSTFHEDCEDGFSVATVYLRGQPCIDQEEEAQESGEG